MDRPSPTRDLSTGCPPRWISRSRPRESGRDPDVSDTSGVPEVVSAPVPAAGVDRSGVGSEVGGGVGTGHRPFFVREVRGVGDFVARRALRGGRCASKPNRDGLVASTRSTVVGGSIRSDPYSTTVTAPAPYLRNAVFAVTISS